MNGCMMGIDPDNLMVGHEVYAAPDPEEILTKAPGELDENHYRFLVVSTTCGTRLIKLYTNEEDPVSYGPDEMEWAHTWEVALRLSIQVEFEDVSFRLGRLLQFMEGLGMDITEVKKLM